MNVDQVTDEDALAEYIPEEFEILRPCVSWGYCNCRDVDFLAGGEYIILQATVPVRFDTGTEVIEGPYPLIIYENNAIPVIGGREETGMLRRVCDISCEHHYEDHYWAAASFESETILKMDIRVTGEPEKVNERVRMDNLGNRMLPNVEKGGNAYHDIVLYPQYVEFDKVWVGSGEITIETPIQYKNWQAHSILSALEELPVRRYENASVS